MSPLAGFRQFLASHTEMSSARNPPTQSYPAVPATLHAGNYAMHDFSDRNASPSTLPYYTPYLGLRARLSQVWINRWTILLLLIVVRLLIAIADVNRSIGSAKTEALSACTSVENVGSAMASMPHYLSQGVNALAADGITNAVEGLMKMILLTVTGVEEMILFWINMLTSTYVCLITLVIGGSLSAALDMIEKVGDFMNKTISGITGEITSTASTFQDGINKVLSGISIPDFLGGSKDPPKLNIDGSLAKLNGITIDTAKMDAELTKLNSSIPDFATVHNFTNNLIRAPFELVKKAINDSLPVYTFDKSVFPVPQKKALTFCSGNSKVSDFFDGLFKTVAKTKITFLVILILLAIAVCVPMAYWEIRRFRTMQKRANLLAESNSFDPMDVINISARPFTSTVGIKLASKFKSTKTQILVRWSFAYATSLPALFVLALGVAGLFSCLCQLIVLRVVQKEVPAIAEEVGGFADDVVLAINNASQSWAVDANNVITSTNDKVNKDVFGWVKISTTAVNKTLNGFTDEMNGALNATFGGTVLYGPVTGLINCLVGIKIAGIEKGLTWVHDNAHVTFPRFNKDVFSLGAAASLTNSTPDDSFLANPGDVTGDGITSAIAKVTSRLEDGLRIEAIISACLIALWFFILLIGVARILFAMMTHDKTRAEGGPVGYTGDNRGSLSPRSPDRNSGNFPTFGGPVSAVTTDPRTGGQPWQAVDLADEKVRPMPTGRRSVEQSLQPGHERVSSYGYLDEKR
ncbi:putative plasma membrane fusion protein prm1 [Amylocarpus encephaloides]|uniref:Plasma membrane fusion protein PRM1 n=1 Tax=Amylocarpus encephaloides TaxID=45428 RepID=A0A9P7YAE4_9HELO|nr:putative plasma membrane fusion protein prm1 [Amylocarpus encephaloides]